MAAAICTSLLSIVIAACPFCEPFGQEMCSYERSEKFTTGTNSCCWAMWSCPIMYDFNVYSKKKEREKLDYMHANRVMRGLVKHPAQWVWSSFSWYEKAEIGLIPVDVAK